MRQPLALQATVAGELEELGAVVVAPLDAVHPHAPGLACYAQRDCSPNATFSCAGPIASECP